MSARLEIWALVPVKRFSAAKTRLASALSGADRAALARAMLGDVLQAIRASDAFAGIMLVTGDAEAAAIGRRFGATLLDDPQDIGVNAAVMRGVAELERIGAAAVLIALGDIPFVAADELKQALEALAESPIVIVPAMRDGGTNLLAMRPPALLATAFGPESFQRHVELASDLGIEPAVLALEGAGRDLDLPSDLEQPPLAGAGAQTRACLARLACAAPAAALHQRRRAAS